MQVEKIKEALEIGLNAVVSAGWTRHQGDDAKEIVDAIEALASLDEKATDSGDAETLDEIIDTLKENAKQCLDDGNSWVRFNDFMDVANSLVKVKQSHAQKCAECTTENKTCYNCAYDNTEAKECNGCLETYAKHWKYDPLKEKQGE